MSTPLGSSWRSRCLESSLQAVSSQQSEGRRKAEGSIRGASGSGENTDARVLELALTGCVVRAEERPKPEARGPGAGQRCSSAWRFDVGQAPQAGFSWQPLDARAAGTCHVLGRAHERTPEHPLEHLHTLLERAGRENSASVVRGVMAPQQRSASRPATGCVERGNRPRIRVFGLEDRDGCLSVWRVAARSPWTAGRRP